MARHERSAGFVVFREDGGGREYLLLNYGKHWDFAKGHVEKGEDDLAAATRELLEETAISDVRPVEGFKHEIVYFFRDRHKGLVRKSVVFFLGETTAADSAIRVSHEHEEFIFLPYEAALKRITFPTAKQVLRVAEEALTMPGDSLSDKRTEP
jgi:bis(5'-nucleosidyl)-tetraphosphatase